MLNVIETEHLVVDSWDQKYTFVNVGAQSPSKRTEYCAISTETLNNYLVVQTFREVQIKYSGKGYGVVF